MINYPNATKSKKLKAINLSGKSNNANRGMTLEENINVSNEYYLKQNIAVIYKKPTPIKVLHISSTESGSSMIDKAHFMMPSTTDYNGIYKGKYIDFEAKETKSKTLFPLSQIHLHQITHLQRIVKHGGIGFVIISFTSLNEIYLVDEQVITDYYDSGKASISYQDIKQKGHLIKEEYIISLNYLKVVDLIYFKCDE